MGSWKINEDKKGWNRGFSTYVRTCSCFRNTVKFCPACYTVQRKGEEIFPWGVLAPYELEMKKIQSRTQDENSGNTISVLYFVAQSFLVRGMPVYKRRRTTSAFHMGVRQTGETGSFNNHNDSEILFFTVPPNGMRTKRGKFGNGTIYM